MARTDRWTRPQLEVAMNLYCKLPFGKFHSRNPLIIEVAALLGRTPSALAMKLSNLASLDPMHQGRGVKGLSAASETDRQVWDEFQADWERCAFESEKRLAELRHQSVEDLATAEEPEPLPKEGIERQRLVMQRVNQSFFRKSVLAAYEGRCCITGLAIPELLTASHIIPWAADHKNRVNPANGLCLNALHDRAFDRGLITLSEKNTVLVSPTLHSVVRSSSSKTEIHAAALEQHLLKFEGASIHLPHRFHPDPAFLTWHREKCFRG